MRKFENTSSAIPKCLTIAGSDPSGGAGIQADLKTFAAFRTYGMSAITAVTVQNSLEVRAIHALPLEIISGQIDAVVDDFVVDAVKTGMMCSAEIIVTVVKSLKRINKLNLVVDPVMMSTSGATLLDSTAIGAMKNLLFPLASVVTPNIQEAEALTSMIIKSKSDVEKSAQILLQCANAVLIKGGHLLIDDNCFDYFVDRNGGSFWLEYPRIATKNTRGTGCTYAAAIAAEIASGQSLVLAVKNARAWLQRAIQSSEGWKISRGPGPLDHGWKPNE